MIISADAVLDHSTVDNMYVHIARFYDTTLLWLNFIVLLVYEADILVFRCIGQADHSRSLACF